VGTGFGSLLEMVMVVLLLLIPKVRGVWDWMIQEVGTRMDQRRESGGRVPRTVCCERVCAARGAHCRGDSSSSALTSESLRRRR
jgi:hypothetical protein